MKHVYCNQRYLSVWGLALFFYLGFSLPVFGQISLPLSNPSACQLGISIPDNSCFTGGIDVPIEVVGAGGSSMGNDVVLTDVNLIIEHTWSGDLEVFLVSPSGEEVELTTDNGSGSDNYGDPNDGTCAAVTNFNMNGSDGSIVFGSAPFIGSYIPEGDFADFNDGTDPNGTWELQICDDVGEDVGELEYVELVFGTPPSAPDNDLCGDAELIECGDVVNGNTDAATTTGAPTNCSGTINTGPGVWYVLEGDGSDVTVSLCGSSFDTKLAVLSGSCGQLVCEGYNDDKSVSGCSLQSEIEFTAAAGTDYYIYVSGFETSSGDYTLSVTCEDPPPPPVENFTCNTAIPAVIGTNETETVNSGDGAENGCSFPISSGSADHARWFTFTPAQNGEYTIGSSGFTSADTRLSIYTGNCGSLSCFASNDDANGLADLASEVTTCLQAGVTYFIEWDNRWSPASFDWEISYNGLGGCGAGGDLPAPWVANDIGNTGNGNDYGFDEGTFTVVSGGRNGYSNSNDNMAFASQTICGNGSITLKVENITGSGFGGVAMRESTAPGSKQAMLLSNQTALLPWLTRTVDNGPNNFTSFFRPYAFWLRLERVGNYIRAYTSTSGNSFTIVAQTYLPMDDCIEIGMIVANTGRNQTTAQFSNVTVVGGAPFLTADETGIEEAQADREQEASGALRGFDQPVVEKSASLFPNPATSRINIDLPAEQPMEATLTLRNQLGQALDVRRVEAGLFRAEWDVSQLSGGVYYMEVRYEGQQPQVLRFVKTN